MCGICGIVTADPLTEELASAVAAMSGAMVHRGPDSEGRFRDERVCLGMRRLSIIDLAGGHQPLYNEDRSLALVANGEIYNFVELRADLEARGHHLATSSDCETIIHLYEEYGERCVDHLRGMFAFALWDARAGRVLIARDRMGEKPLYFTQRDGRILFASEMKSLLASGLVDFELDPTAVDHYFHYQYVPEPMTAVRGVWKLDAGHVMTIDVAPWRVERKQYWSMEDAPPLEGDSKSIIRDELETISRLIVRSDVPVGIALSGGLDSSAVAVLAARAYPGTMHAFSVGYPGSWQNDERADAKALADHLEMPFHDIELSEGQLVEFFPELVSWQDDPIADISGYGYHSISRIAKENGVPVMLQGQGGDELFWGYPWVQMAARLTRTRAGLSGNGVGVLGFLGFELPRGLSRSALGHWVRTWGGLRSGWRAIRTHLRSDPDQMFFYDFGPDFPVALTEAAGCYTPAFAAQLDAAAGPRSLFALDRPWPDAGVAITRLICDTYLRENGIAQGDRLAMASSVELRLPLVDYRLVEIAIGLRKASSDLDLPAKARFKETISELLPDWVLNRPKRGFSPPIRDWYAALFARHGQALRDGYLVEAGVLDPARAAELAAGHYPRGQVAPMSFKALVLELWCRAMVQACRAPERAAAACS